MIPEENVLTIESELESIVREKVDRPADPAPAPLVSVAEMQAELEGLKAGTIKRPSPKQAYLSRVSELEDEIKAIAAQNAAILADNAAVKKDADNQYLAALEDAKRDTANKGEALCRCVRAQLQQTGYFDLLGEQAAAWRENMLKTVTVTASSDIDTAIAEYTALMAEKETFELKLQAPHQSNSLRER